MPDDSSHEFSLYLGFAGQTAVHRAFESPAPKNLPENIASFHITFSPDLNSHPVDPGKVRGIIPGADIKKECRGKI
jgi:hypothetical protein